MIDQLINFTTLFTRIKQWIYRSLERERKFRAKYRSEQIARSYGYAPGGCGPSDMAKIRSDVPIFRSGKGEILRIGDRDVSKRERQGPTVLEDLRWFLNPWFID